MDLRNSTVGLCRQVRYRDYPTLSKHRSPYRCRSIPVLQKRHYPSASDDCLPFRTRLRSYYEYKTQNNILRSSKNNTVIHILLLLLLLFVIYVNSHAVSHRIRIPIWLHTWQCVHDKINPSASEMRGRQIRRHRGKPSE